MNTGVYTIQNKINQKLYVGSSANIKSRWLAHLNTLRKGTHHNIKLQNSFNKNPDCFEFTI